MTIDCTTKPNYSVDYMQLTPKSLFVFHKKKNFLDDGPKTDSELRSESLQRDVSKILVKG